MSTTVTDSLYVLLGLKTDEASLKRAEGAVDALGGKLKAVAATAAAVLAPAVLFNYVKTGVEQSAMQADALIKEARTAGITTEAYQELAFAAGLSGVNQEQLRKGLLLTNKASQDAARDNKALANTYREIGLSAKEMAQLSPDEQFTRLVGALQGVEDKGKRAAISTKLLGEAGSRFASLIEGGVEGLNAARQEAQDRGLIISTKDSEAAEKFNDSMDRLKKTGEGLKTQFFMALIPAAQDILDMFLEFQKEGLLGNAESMKLLAGEIRKFVKDLKPFIKSMLVAYKAIGGVSGALKLLLIGVAAVGGAKGLIMLTKASNGAMLANLKLAASTLLAAAPYILLALAIGAVLLALDDMRGWIEGEDSLMGDVFGEFNEETLKKIQGALIAIGIVLAVMLGGTLGIVAILALAAAALFIFWDDLGLMFEEFFDEMIRMWNEWVDGLDWEEWTERLRDQWDDLVKDMTKMWEDFVALVMEGVEKISSPIETLTAAVDARTGGIGGGVLRGVIGGPAVQAYDALQAARGMGAGGVSNRRVDQRNEITIGIDGSNLSPDQLRGAVADGVDDGLLRTLNAGYEGSEI